MTNLMTQLMREEIADQEINQHGGVMGLVQAKQRQAIIEKQERFLKIKLNRSIKIRNSNRLKNKNARRARSKQR